MTRNIALGVTIAIGMVLATSVAMAQQKQHLVFKTPAANTKYLQQHIIDVGDVPGHQIRVFEIQRTYPPESARVINGLKLKEYYTRAVSD
jgi:hypothetical protein